MIEGDYSEASGTRATYALLGRRGAPTAIIYDNDVVVRAGLGVVSEMGVRGPKGCHSWHGTTRRCAG